MASLEHSSRGVDLAKSFIASEKLPYHFVIFFAFVLLAIYATANRPKFPVFNPSTSATEFMRKSKDLFITGRSKFGTRPYIMRTYLGNAIVLPPQMMNEVRNLEELDFWAAMETDHHGRLRGFEAFKANHEGATMINRHLTKALGKHTRPLFQETKSATRDLFTDSKDWHEMHPSRELAMLIARISTRLFLGAELCRDQNWIKLTSGYTHVVFQAVQALRQFPPILRPFANRLLPICSKTRAALQACRDYMQPIVQAREARKTEAAARGDPEPVYNDAIEWCQKEYSSDRDPADSQISLAMVAIHPTTDLLTETMVRIARHPEVFKPLREEVVKVLGSEGLTKTALYNLKLLDSVIKESQRLKPVAISNFRRVVVKDVTLSDGIRLRKGDLVWIDNAHMWDNIYWENADQFDAYRFVKLRSTEKEHMAHLVTTSPEHLGFGHGRQACPGRFAAAHMIKILLSYLVLTYDWTLPEGHDPPSIAHGMNLMPHPSTKLLIRRREAAEIDFEMLKIEED